MVRPALRFYAFPLLLLGLYSLRAEAYIDTCPSLGSALSASTSIVVLEVEKVSLEKRVIIYKKTADLKGTHPEDRIKHVLTDGAHPREPKGILDWARPGRTALGFHNGKIFVTCLGSLWYESALTESSWWTMTRGCPEMLYSYAGSVDRLRRHVVDMLTGKEVVVTAVSYAGTSSTNFTMAIHYRSSLRGVPLCRLKAGLQHTTYRPQQVVGKNGGSEDDVPGLLTGLENSDAARRADAAEDLGRIGPPAKAAVPALARRLKDADPQVRIASAAAIASIDPKNPDVLPAALAELKGAAEQRRVAADLLGDLGAVSVPTLSGALKDVDANVRWAAAESLGRIGPAAKAAVTDLAAALADKEIRSIAADALGSIGKEAKAGVPGLVQIVREEKDPSLRMTAGVALARIDPSAAGPAAPLFAEALRNPDGRVRHDATIMLQMLGPAGREATPILTELLREKAQYMRQIAANAVCYSRDPRAVPALVEALEKDAEVSVRSTAAMALGFVGPDAKAAVPALEGKLKDADIGTRIVSAEALWKITKDEERTVPVLIEALRHKNTYMVGLSAGILGRMGPAAKRGIPDLLGLLKASDETQRRVAGQLLKGIDPKAAADAGVK